MPTSVDKAPSTLPAHAKEIWTAAFNSAHGDDCDDACAAKQAWGAVKAKYTQHGEKWVPKSAMAGLSLYFTKTQVQSRRWAATASDTLPDQHGDEATLELFSNFQVRAATTGNYGYLSVAHYMDMEVPLELRSKFGDKTSAGPITEMFISDNRFRVRGTYAPTPLGTAVMQSVRADHAMRRPLEESVRLSLGFLDLKHSHRSDGFVFTRRSLSDVCPRCAAGEGGRRFLDGELVHIAVTRVPVNPRTPFDNDAEVQQMSDNAITTVRDDAASIVGEELADELEALNAAQAQQMSLVHRSDPAAAPTPGNVNVQAPPVVDPATVATMVSQQVQTAIAALSQSAPAPAPVLTPETDPLTVAFEQVRRANSKAGLATALAQLSQVAHSQLVVTDVNELIADAVNTAIAPLVDRITQLSQNVQTAPARGQLPGQPPARPPVTVPVQPHIAALVGQPPVQVQGSQNGAVAAGAAGSPVGTPTHAPEKMSVTKALARRGVGLPTDTTNLQPAV